MRIPLERSAAGFIPPHAHSLEELAQAAQTCQGCDLYKKSTQAVFGEGPARSRVMLVGEIPGNLEDKKGRPFVGPAGGLLNKALFEAGLDRKDLYVTNAVKHFRFMQLGAYRYHRNPTGLQIQACHPWLETEIQMVQPEMVVGLGTLAARALFQRPIILKEVRGKIFPFDGRHLLITVHPAWLLRMLKLEADRQKQQLQFNHFVSDLRKVKRFLTEQQEAA